MARPLRIDVAGAWYPVMNPGRCGQALFLDDADFRCQTLDSGTQPPITTPGFVTTPCAFPSYGPRRGTFDIHGAATASPRAPFAPVEFPLPRNRFQRTESGSRPVRFRR